jgi:predicted transcriptional regulator
MEEVLSETPLTELTAKIVAAYCRRNSVPPEQMPLLMKTVHDSLAGLTAMAVSPAEPLEPFVPIRRSVTDDSITCLECGYKGKMIKRHLARRHDMTPDQYRQRWKLSQDYPMLARGYSEVRSQLAKKIGLGLRDRLHRSPEPEPERRPPPPPPSSRRGRARRSRATAA